MHGKLYLNNQLANFAEVGRACTFCVIQEEKKMRNENVRVNGPEHQRRIANLSNETVSHMLWECRWVNSTIQCTFNRLTGDINRDVDINTYMGGWTIENSKKQEVVLIVIHFIKYVLYVCRNRRIVPSVTHLCYEIDELLLVMRKRKKWISTLPDLGDTLKGIFSN